MDCPRCATVALAERERSGLTIDFCTNCRGVWLDGGELEKLIQSEQSYYRDDDRDRGRSRDRDNDDDEGGGFLQNIMDIFGGGD
jgi:Zn-finger nucleic acid-binding protein